MLTEEQKAALAQLRAVKCKVNPDGCEEGPWCAARARVLKAFETPTTIPCATEPTA